MKGKYSTASEFASILENGPPTEIERFIAVMSFIQDQTAIQEAQFEAETFISADDSNDDSDYANARYERLFS